ncbi:LPS export ABC transporter permease LptF, partial [Neisseria meningitidis]|uniref:LptF/LptG family permease n=1 Tax=Neisseria meningitidis TaxID=487 RepID=UPI000CAD8E94
ELRSREYAEILKQKQELSLVEAGGVNRLGKRNGRGFFVGTFDTETGIMKNLFLREQDKNGGDNNIFAKKGNFSLKDNKRPPEMRHGYRYSATPGRPDYNQFPFQNLTLITSPPPNLIAPFPHRRTIPTAQLIGSSNPQHQAELMWRISLTVSVLLL